jgi:hypothetical protein
MTVLTLSGCGNNSPKIKPRFKPIHIGVDRDLQPELIEYVKLAKNNGIKFKRPITMGFADIDVVMGTGRVVGICFNHSRFKEIDIDKKQWKDHSEISRKNLLFHELTHCLCGRGHDYGDGERYQPLEIEKVLDFIHNWPFYVPRPGRYVDGCPLTIMYTHVLPDSCLQIHQTEYFTEMFNRCNPW